THYRELMDYWAMISTPGSGSGSAAGGIPGESDDFLDNLLKMVQTVIPLLTMVMAVKRLNIQAMPDGVVQHFRSMNVDRHSSKPALPELIKAHIKNLEEDANSLLDDIKILIQSADPTAGIYSLEPFNWEGLKYFRT